MVGEAAALGSAVLWAISAVAVKTVSGRLSAFYIMTVRTSVAAVFVLVLFGLSGGDATVVHLSLATIAVLLGSGGAAILGDAAFVRAMAVEDVSRVFTVSTSLYILASVTGSVIFLGEPLSAFLLLGGLAVLVGARLVVYEQVGARLASAGRGRQPVFALWLAVLAALLWTASLLTVADALESVEALSATALRLPFMAFVLGVIAGSRGEHRRRSTLADLRLLAISGALIAGATTLFLLAAKTTSAGTVAVLTSTSPIFVAPMAHAFLGERLTPRIAGGTATCMAGIWLAIL